MVLSTALLLPVRPSAIRVLGVRRLLCTAANRGQLNQPMGGNEMPRFAGPGTMMRLPAHPGPGAQGLDACFVGCGIDIGTSNRAGTRHGPRAIRWESAMLRPYNMATGAAPFDALQVADVGTCVCVCVCVCVCQCVFLSLSLFLSPLCLSVSLCLFLSHIPRRGDVDRCERGESLCGASHVLRMVYVL